MGIIPAQWPEQAATARSSQSHGLDRIQPVSRQVPARMEKVYDDTQWRSAAE